MKTIYNQVKTFLETHSWARERAFRDQAIIIILRENYQNIGQATFPVDKLLDFCRDYVSYERLWRKVTQENPDLRGKDWEDKVELEQNEQMKMGYESRFHENVKQLELLK